MRRNTDGLLSGAIFSLMMFLALVWLLFWAEY